MALNLNPAQADTITPDQRAYIRAGQIADLLLAHGLPVLSFDSYDQGFMVAWVIAPTPNERMIVKRATADADPEEVEAYIRRLMP